MNFDFLADLAEEIKRFLREAGLEVPTYEQLRLQDKRNDEVKNNIQHYDLDNLLIHFFTINSRRIPIISWSVKVSNKLQGRSEILEIVDKLESGQDVNDLLSNNVRKLNQAKHVDLLRAEWGIYHLHFKENRSGDLLFAYFNENDAYLINILGHEKLDGSIVTWTNTDLIQVMHDNWPHIIKPYIFKMTSDTPILTIEQRRTLRKKAAITTIVVNDGTEYMPLGGGFSSSKHPILAVVQSDFLFSRVKDLQTVVKGKHPAIKQALAAYTSEPILKLRLGDDFQPLIVEARNNILIDL